MKNLKQGLVKALYTLLFSLAMSTQASAQSWPCKSTFTYKIENYHPTLSVLGQRQAIAQALATWQPFFRVSFVETSSASSDLTFRWSTSGFYGGGTRMSELVVGNEYGWPDQGLISINLSKNWSLNSGSNGVHHLETALLHGIGRAMGQPTRGYVGPVMYSSYVGMNTQLHLDDIHWSQWAYTHVSACSNYWDYHVGNDGKHFTNTHEGDADLASWPIASTDDYLAGNFSESYGPELLMIKPGQRALMITRFDSNALATWRVLNKQNHAFAGVWWTAADDKHAVGDFNGDGYDDILFANPSGHYKTFSFNNGGWWNQLQSASNGDIDWDDRLLAGDFNGDGVDEVLLIKPSTGAHFTMRLNAQTQNWDILSQGTNGQIYWWGISANDHYVTGDFNGDGKDELLAANANGWHHTMTYANNQWGYLEGAGNGSIAYWQIGTSDTFVAVDINGDGQSEVLVYNVNNGWSHTLGFSGNQWQWLAGNGGDGDAGYWDFAAGDIPVAGAATYAPLLFLNPNGWWKIIRY